MSQNVYDILMERGFIEQCTHPEEVRELLGGTGTGYLLHRLRRNGGQLDGRAFSHHYGHDAYAESGPQAHRPFRRRNDYGGRSFWQIRYAQGDDKRNH